MEEVTIQETKPQVNKNIFDKEIGEKDINDLTKQMENLKMK